MQEDTEPGVDVPENRFGFGDDVAPFREGVGVAGLQRDDPQPGTVGERVIGFEQGPGLLVEGVKGGDGGGVAAQFGCVPGGVGMFVEVLDEHPELGAPVAEVVLPYDIAAEEPQDAGDAVTDDRRTEVPDVHFLGDVGCRVVDDRAAARFGGADSEPVGCESGGDLSPDGGVHLDDLRADAEPRQGAADAVVSDAPRHHDGEPARVLDSGPHGAGNAVLPGEHHCGGVAGRAAVGDDPSDVPHRRDLVGDLDGIAEQVAQPSQDGDPDEGSARGVEALVDQVLLGQQCQHPCDYVAMPGRPPCPRIRGSVGSPRSCTAAAPRR